jgi:psiF repeat
MSMIKTGLTALALAFALSTSALAQTPPSAAKPAAPAAAPAVTAPAKAAKAPKAAAKPRTEISLACSKQADEKKLTGKERKKFRDGCMKPSAAKKN